MLGVDAEEDSRHRGVRIIRSCHPLSTNVAYNNLSYMRAQVRRGQTSAISIDT